MILVAFILLWAVAIAFPVGGMIRATWVGKVRGRIIDNCSSECSAAISGLTREGIRTFSVNKFYDAYLGRYYSFSKMMEIRYWGIWDVEQLRHYPDPKHEEWPDYLGV